MKHRHPLSALCGTAALIALLFGTASTAHADLNFKVSLDTTPLTGSLAVNAPFRVNFQLIDGDGVANNLVTIENFSFGSGSAGGDLLLFGGAAGDLTGSITLSDPDPGFIFNAFFQRFTPGNTLAFDVHTTTNYVGGTPDRFSFSIQDRWGADIPTSGMAWEFIGVDLNGPTPVVEVYGAAGDYEDMGTPGLAMVPEPSPLALLALALPIAAGRLRKRHA